MKKIVIRVASVVVAIIALLVSIKNTFGSSRMAWSAQVGDISSVFKNEKWLKSDSDVEVTAYYSEGYMTRQEIQHIITTIATELGVKDGYDYETINLDSSQVSMLTKEAEQARTCVKFTMVENMDSKGKVEVYNYLYVRIDLHNSPQSAFYYMTKLNKILDDFDIDQRCTMNFQGKINGSTDKKERENKVDAIFESVGAKEVDCVNTEGIYSVYGYTDRLQGHVTTDGRKINLNVSFNYDEEKDETNIYIASPVLSVDY